MSSLEARLAASSSTPEEQAAGELEPSARALAVARRFAARLVAVAAVELPVAEEPALPLLAALTTEAGCSEEEVAAAALDEPGQPGAVAAVQRAVWVPLAAWRSRSSSLPQSKEA